MSWPTDGKPRYVTGHVSGARIPKGGGGPEFYVYDRANCSRIVHTERGAGGWRDGLAARRAELRAQVLNDLAAL